MRKVPEGTGRCTREVRLGRALFSHGYTFRTLHASVVKEVIDIVSGGSLGVERAVHVRQTNDEVRVNSDVRARHAFAQPAPTRPSLRAWCIYNALLCLGSVAVAPAQRLTERRGPRAADAYVAMRL